MYKRQELLLTGDLVSAEEALGLGFLNYVSNDPLGKAREIAGKISGNGPIAVQAIRKSVRACLGMEELSALKLESKLAAPVFETEEAKEGPLAFMEKRTPVYQGR